MTQQVKPIMHFNHDTYSIIKESDRDAFRSFFDPKEHGFKPVFDGHILLGRLQMPI